MLHEFGQLVEDQIGVAFGFLPGRLSQQFLVLVVHEGSQLAKVLFDKAPFLACRFATETNPSLTVALPFHPKPSLLYLG